MFLTNILFDKLNSMEITNKQQMMVCIESTTGTDDNGNIKLDDNVVQILNIIIIILWVVNDGGDEAVWAKISWGSFLTKSNLDEE